MLARVQAQPRPARRPRVRLRRARLRTLAHNLIAHPVAGLLWALGFEAAGESVHRLWEHEGEPGESVAELVRELRQRAGVEDSYPLAVEVTIEVKVSSGSAEQTKTATGCFSHTYTLEAEETAA